MQAVSRDPIATAKRWASFYRSLGFNPLPSSPEHKRPLVRYAQWWEADAPADLFDRHETTNLQIMTGRHWGLLVIDLDGPEAIEHWPKMAPCLPTTWITHSGGGGQHWWFAIPRDLPPMPKARLWGEYDPAANDGKGDWVRRKAIERLCDRSLVVAPPSIHPKTGRTYRFLDKRHSPTGLAMPAMAPRWILDLKPIEAPKQEVKIPANLSIARKAPRTSPERFVERNAVLLAVDDKIAVARSWGLRIASERPNGSGWCPCHAIDREDSHPSASFNPTTGHYWEPGSNSISLFDLGVRLGVYADWLEAKNDLAGQHLRSVGA